MKLSISKYFAKILLRNVHQFQGLSPILHQTYSRPGHFGAIPSICNQRSLPRRALKMPCKFAIFLFYFFARNQISNPYLVLLIKLGRTSCSELLMRFVFANKNIIFAFQQLQYLCSIIKLNSFEKVLFSSSIYFPEQFY